MKQDPGLERLRLAFGAFFDFETAQQEETLSYLRQAWLAQFGQPPRSLTVDLESLSSWYRPQVAAKNLRDLADSLGMVNEERPHIQAELYIAVDESRGIVTPEGRALIELVHARNQPEEDRDAFVISVMARLVEFYSGPRREWMQKTVIGGDLRPPTLGYAVFLLINGSIGEDRALRIPRSQSDDTRLAQPVVAVSNTFASAIGGSPLKGRELTRLRSNWAVSEAGRQMPGLIRNQPTAGKGLLSFIAIGAEQRTVEKIAAALILRKSFDPACLPVALKATTDAYGEARPLLKSWEMSWESSPNTRKVCAQLESAVTRLASRY